MRAARDSNAQKIRDVSQLTTGLSGCGVRAVDGREFNHEVAFPFNRKEAAEALAAPVRAVGRINPDCWYEVEIVVVRGAADNEAINTIAPGMM